MTGEKRDPPDQRYQQRRVQDAEHRAGGEREPQQQRNCGGEPPPERCGTRPTPRRRATRACSERSTPHEGGLAYERYDENTGVYTQYVNRRTGRNCNGEIYDEAKGAISLCGGRAVSGQEQRRQHEPERQNRRWHRGGDNGEHRGRNLCEHRSRRRFECDGGRQVHSPQRKAQRSR